MATAISDAKLDLQLQELVNRPPRTRTERVAYLRHPERLMDVPDVLSVDTVCAAGHRRGPSGRCKRVETLINTGMPSPKPKRR